MASKVMFEDDSDAEDIGQFTINEHYAKAFQYKREREELAKLKEKYGSDYEEEEDEEDSEDLESEDEDGEELTPAVDAAILRTLARIKNRDPEIYNSDKSIFHEEEQRTSKYDTKSKRPKDKSKSKPLNIRHAKLQSVLDAANSRSPSPELMTHVEEQAALRDETRAAFQNAVSDEEDEILIPREKTRDEIEQEEEDYRAFLTREVGQELEQLVMVDDSENIVVWNDDEDLEPTKRRKKSKDSKAGNQANRKSKQEEDQEFLLGYILNRGWIDRSSRRVPTYKEIVDEKMSYKKGEITKTSEESEDSDHEADAQNNEVDLVDEDFDEIADRFENSYNFRFEEPDGTEIKSFPRSIPMTIRREDTSRKEARERRRERKQEELDKKREEVRRLKALKMREVRRKLERIGREGGLALSKGKDEALQELDLDADWDPDTHDHQMAGLYGDEDGSEADLEKPTWDDDIDINDIIPPEVRDEGQSLMEKKRKKRKKDKNGKGEEEEDGVDIDAMDADVERDEDDEEWDGTEEMRKRKLEEYMNDIYALDFNDMVAGMPTRFRYTQVAPQNFSLTPADILMATDTDLNQFMSVKRYAPYRAETWDHNRGQRLLELREKIRERTGDSVIGNQLSGTGDKPAKKRIGKKERQRLKAAVGGAEKSENDVDSKETKSSEKRKREHEDGDDDVKIEEAGEVAAPPENGGSRKKRRRKHKKSSAGQQPEHS